MACFEGLATGKDAVINLVGILHDLNPAIPYGKGFAAAHVELPKKIVAACKVAGVKRLLYYERTACWQEGTFGIPAL